MTCSANVQLTSKAALGEKREGNFPQRSNSHSQDAMWQLLCPPVMAKNASNMVTRTPKI